MYGIGSTDIAAAEDKELDLNYRSRKIVELYIKYNSSELGSGGGWTPPAGSKRK